MTRDEFFDMLESHWNRHLFSKYEQKSTQEHNRVVADTRELAHAIILQSGVVKDVSGLKSKIAAGLVDSISNAVDAGVPYENFLPLFLVIA